MHFHNNHHVHSHDAASPSTVLVAAAALMARQNDPFPQPSTAAGPVGDFGILSNLTAHETYDTTYTEGLVGVNQPQNYMFAWVCVITILSLGVLTLFFRWARMGNAQLRQLFTIGNPEHQKYWSQNHTGWWPKIKQHVLYAPLFRARHNKEIQLSRAVSIGTLPSRFHAVLIGIYLFSNIAYCLVLSWERPVFASVVAELRGRSGVLATLNLIPTILFALRNNPLIPLLRVSYDTFNLFHRWCARVVVIEALIHTVAFLINSSASGISELSNTIATSSSYQWGLVATIALMIILVQAFSPIRHAFYETFVTLHRILVVLTLVGVWYHIERANLPQLPWLRACFALWGYEWGMRMYRTIYYNLSVKTGMTKVIVEALPSEACRVTFLLSRPWHARPGSHVHVYLPSIGWLSSHPFSVAWSETRPRGRSADGVDLEKAVDTPQRRGSTLKMPGMDPNIVVQELAASESPKTASVSTVSLVMRARTGMTKHLYDKASKSPNGQIIIRGALEGPYGGHESMSSYGTVVLFAGGVGITHCISYVRELLQEYADGTCSTRRILLVWSVPNTEALEWVRPWMDQVLRMEGRKEVLRIQLFITKPRHQNEIKSHTGTVQMFPGRCNPSTVLDKEIVDRVGAMGVVVCGPGAFADGVRAATRDKVQLGSVDFIEEAFTY